MPKQDLWTPRPLPALTGSAVPDPWRIRHRLDLQSLLVPEPRRSGPTRSELLLRPRPQGWQRLDDLRRLDADWRVASIREDRTTPSASGASLKHTSAASSLRKSAGTKTGKPRGSGKIR